MTEEQAGSLTQVNVTNVTKLTRQKKIVSLLSEFENMPSSEGVFVKNLEIIHHDDFVYFRKKGFLKPLSIGLNVLRWTVLGGAIVFAIMTLPILLLDSFLPLIYLFFVMMVSLPATLFFFLFKHLSKLCNEADKYSWSQKFPVFDLKYQEMLVPGHSRKYNFPEIIALKYVSGERGTREWDRLEAELLHGESVFLAQIPKIDKYRFSKHLKKLIEDTGHNFAFISD